MSFSTVHALLEGGRGCDTTVSGIVSSLGVLPTSPLCVSSSCAPPCVRLCKCVLLLMYNSILTCAIVICFSTCQNCVSVCLCGVPQCDMWRLCVSPVGVLLCCWHLHPAAVCVSGNAGKQAHEVLAHLRSYVCCALSPFVGHPTTNLLVFDKPYMHAVQPACRIALAVIYCNGWALNGRVYLAYMSHPHHPIVCLLR